MGAQRRKRSESQHTGSYLRSGGCVGRRFVRLSLLPFCQTASAFRLTCLFHTFFRRGVYRAMVFAPLRCPKLFRFPFALFVGCSFCLFCSSLNRIRRGCIFFGGHPTFLYLFMRIGSYAQCAKDRVPVFDYDLTTITCKTEKAGLSSVFNGFAIIQKRRTFSPKAEHSLKTQHFIRIRLKTPTL